MTVVTEDLSLPDGSAPKQTLVTVYLAGEDGAPFPAGYATADGVTVVGRRQVKPDRDGVWSMDLVANSDITPSGTVWAVVLSAGGGNVQRDARYFEVPASGGPYTVEELLTDPPGPIPPASVVVERDRAEAAEAALAASVTAEAVARAAADALLAPKASPTFTGTPTAPTAAPGTSTTQVATTAFVAAAAAALVNAAPGALDTLKELADALGDDPNFATTITNLIATETARATAAEGAIVAGLPTLVVGSTAAAVNTVLAALPAWSVGDPLRRVLLSGGAWTLSTAIRVPSGVVLDLSNGARLKLASGANCDVITNSDWVNGNSDIQVVGGYLDGDRTNQTGGLYRTNGIAPVVGDGPGQSLISMVNVARARIHGVSGRSPVLHGVDMSVRDPATGAGEPGCTDFSVTDCYFTDFGDDGITTHWSGRGTISGCVAWSSAASYSGSSNGVEIDDGSYEVTVSGCVSVGCVTGFQAQGHEGRVAARDVAFNGCVAIDCEKAFSATAGTAMLATSRSVTVNGGVAVGCDNGVRIDHYQGVQVNGVTFHDCGDLFETLSTSALLTKDIHYNSCTITGATTTTLDKAGIVGAMFLNGCQWSNITAGNTIGIAQDDVTLTNPVVSNCTAGTAGIYIYNGCRRAVVDHPTIYGCSSHGLRIAEAYDFQITNPNIHDNGATASGIYFPASTSYVPTGRIRGGRSHGKYGLRVDVTTGQVAVKDIDLVGTTAPTSIAALAGFGFSYRNVGGFPSENTGTTAIAAAATSVTVTHGLSITPEPAAFSVTPLGSLGSAARWWVSNITSTTFQINVDVAPGGGGVVFAWQANASTPVASYGYSVNLTAASGEFLSSADLPGLGTGDLELIIGVAMADWTPATAQYLISQGSAAGLDFAFSLQVTSAGLLSLSTSADGTTTIIRTSTSPVSATDGTLKYVRVTLDVVNPAGTGKDYAFYEGDSPTGPWTSLGAFTVSGTTSVFAAASVIRLGASGTAGTRLIGKLKYAQIISGGVTAGLLDLGAVPVRGSRDPIAVVGSVGSTWSIGGAAWSWVP